MTKKARLQTKPATSKPTISLSRPSILQRTCACGGVPGLTGECEACSHQRLSRSPGATNLSTLGDRSSNDHTTAQSQQSPLSGYSFGKLAIAPKERLGIQTKLAIGQPGDQHERGTDRVAEQVMWMPNMIQHRSLNNNWQRLQRQLLDKEENKKETHQEDAIASKNLTRETTTIEEVSQPTPEPGATKNSGKKPGKQIRTTYNCPEGYQDLGKFKLTAYVLAQEKDFPEEPKETDPCGLKGIFSKAFLFQSSKAPRGVKVQGSGMSHDGDIIHYKGKNCFEVIDCPRTATGSCATTDRTVAVDPAVIPLKSRLIIEGLGERVAEDTGGGVRGAHIDVYYGTNLSASEANTKTETGKTVCRKLIKPKTE